MSIIYTNNLTLNISIHKAPVPDTIINGKQVKLTISTVLSWKRQPSVLFSTESMDTILQVKLTISTVLSWQLQPSDLFSTESWDTILL